MAVATVKMVTESIDAFAKNDVELAKWVLFSVLGHHPDNIQKGSQIL